MRSFIINSTTNHLLLFLFYLCYISMSCEAPQPLAADGPEDIQPIILLTKDLNNQTGKIKYLISVTLKDKNGRNVTLTNCNIYVNDSLMSPPDWTLFGGKRYYYKSTIPVEPNTLYTFKIIFADGEIREAWIRTPAVEIISMTIPEKHKRETALQIQWFPKDYMFPQKVIIQYWDVEDGFSSNDQAIQGIPYPYMGVYTLDKAYLKYTNESDEVLKETRIILVSETTGVLDKNFLYGSSITAQLRIYQDLEIY